MRALNRFIANYVLRVTASQNVPTERIGLVNRISGGVHRFRQVLRRVKRANRRLYYTAKYTLWAVLLYAVFLRHVHLGSLSDPDRPRPPLADGRVLRRRRPRALRPPRLLPADDAAVDPGASRARPPLRRGGGRPRRRGPGPAAPADRGMGNHRAADRHLPGEPAHRAQRRPASSARRTAQACGTGYACPSRPS